MFSIKIVFTKKSSQILYQWGNTGNLWKNQTQKLQNLLPTKKSSSRKFTLKIVSKG